MPAPFKPSGTTIPLDLLTRLIDSYDPADDGPVLARLARCSTLCHELAIRPLYKHIHLYSDTQVRRLLSDLSIPRSADGKALPCEYLADIPITPRRKSKAGKGKATRKLSHFLLTRHVSLHYVPSPSAIPEQLVTGSRGSFCPKPEVWICPEPEVWIQRVSGEFIPVHGGLFPYLDGIALGKGFMPQFVTGVTVMHTRTMPCEDPQHHGSRVQWVERPQHFGHEGIRAFVTVFKRISGFTHYCWDLDDIPLGLCDQIKRDLVTALVNDRTWGNGYLVSTHSTFPPTSLDPWTRTRRQIRHYVTVDTSSSSSSNDNDADACEDGDEGEQAKLLETLARDAYTAASNSSKLSETLQRHMVYSGLSEAQVRRLEQKFVNMLHPNSNAAAKRKDKFRFFHSAQTLPCAACGEGDGTVVSEDGRGF